MFRKSVASVLILALWVSALESAQLFYGAKRAFAADEISELERQAVPGDLTGSDLPEGMANQGQGTEITTITADDTPEGIAAGAEKARAFISKAGGQLAAVTTVATGAGVADAQGRVRAPKPELMPVDYALEDAAKKIADPFDAAVMKMRLPLDEETLRNILNERTFKNRVVFSIIRGVFVAASVSKGVHYEAYRVVISKGLNPLWSYIVAWIAGGIYGVESGGLQYNMEWFVDYMLKSPNVTTQNIKYFFLEFSFSVVPKVALALMGTYLLGDHQTFDLMTWSSLASLMFTCVAAMLGQGKLDAAAAMIFRMALHKAYDDVLDEALKDGKPNDVIHDPKFQNRAFWIKTLRDGLILMISMGCTFIYGVILSDQNFWKFWENPIPAMGTLAMFTVGHFVYSLASRVEQTYQLERLITALDELKVLSVNEYLEHMDTGVENLSGHPDIGSAKAAFKKMSISKRAAYLGTLKERELEAIRSKFGIQEGQAYKKTLALVQEMERIKYLKEHGSLEGWSKVVPAIISRYTWKLERMDELNLISFYQKLKRELSLLLTPTLAPCAASALPT